MPKKKKAKADEPKAVNEAERLDQLKDKAAKKLGVEVNQIYRYIPREKDPDFCVHQRKKLTSQMIEDHVINAAEPKALEPKPRAKKGTADKKAFSLTEDERFSLDSCKPESLAEMKARLINKRLKGSGVKLEANVTVKDAIRALKAVKAIEDFSPEE